MFRGTVAQIATYLLIVCLLSITFLVFVNASISFVITDILRSHEHVGNDVGTLGFADELVAMVACPIWGVLSDRIGARLVVVISYIVIAISLFCFVNTSKVFPDLLLVRILFSIGGAGASTMVTAILPSLTATSTKLSRTASVSEDAQDSYRQSHQQGDRTLEQDSNPEDHSAAGSGSFRIAGFVGTAAGCGALLAVFGFLRLPPFLQGLHIPGATALRDTFYVVGVVALFAAIVSFFGLRKIVATRRPAEHYQHQRGLILYLDMPLSAVLAAFRSHAIALAYLGGFVARASSVGISLFIPLWINSFYIKSGHCQIDDPSDVENECRQAYQLSSIITGVTQLAALICAPLFGLLSEKLNLRRAPLILAAAAGVAGYSILACVDDPRIREGNIGPGIFAVAILVGLSQVGSIVCSLGLLSHTIATSKIEIAKSTAPLATVDNGEADDAVESQQLLSEGPRAYQSPQLVGDGSLQAIRGSIAGMYSFAGGVGILLLTKVGGSLFDGVGAAGAFGLLACFNVVLLVATGASAAFTAAHKLL